MYDKTDPGRLELKQHPSKLLCANLSSHRPLVITWGEGGHCRTASFPDNRLLVPLLESDSRADINCSAAQQLQTLGPVHPSDVRAEVFHSFIQQTGGQFHISLT